MSCKIFSFLFLCAIFFSSCTDVIKIGVFEPFTGSNSNGGKEESLGIMYANYQIPSIKINNKNYKIQLIYADNKSSISEAPLAAKKLASCGVDVILGSYGSSVSISSSQVFQENKIPVLGITCTNPDVTKNNPYYFRVCYTDNFQGTALAEFVVDQLNAKNIVCIAKENDDYSIGLCQFFIDRFKALGGKSVVEYYKGNSEEFEKFLSKAVSTNADAVLAPLSVDDSLELIDAAEKINFDKPFISGDILDAAGTLQKICNSNQRLYITSFFIEGSFDRQVIKFTDGFKKYLRENKEAFILNGEIDEIFASTVMGYEAYQVIIDSLKRIEVLNRVTLRDAIAATDFISLSGPISFDENGDARRNLAYIKYASKNSQNWQFVTVQKVK